MKWHQPLFVFLLCCATSLNALAEDSTSTTTTFSQSALSESETRLAKLWSLDPAEWKRYQQLMQGPRGIWSPNLDPLSVLGIAASSDAERQRYAEKLARLERTRLQQELLFEAAYQQAQKRLFGNVSLFIGNTPFANKHKTADKRQQFFVRLPCADCLEALKPLLTKVAKHPLDIYLQNAPSDEAIRDWASAMQIPARLVTTGKVTLNHDKGLAKQSGITAFPATRLVDGGQR